MQLTKFAKNCFRLSLSFVFSAEFLVTTKSYTGSCNGQGKPRLIWKRPKNASNKMAPEHDHECKHVDIYIVIRVIRRTVFSRKICPRVAS